MSARPEECDDIQTWREYASTVTHRLAEIEALSRKTHEQLVLHISQEARTQQAIIDLLETWHGAQFTAKVVKWTVPILAGIGAAVMWIKDHVRL